MIIVLNFWDVTNLPPLNKISSRDLKKDEKDYLGFEEIGTLCPDVIFALPGSFLFNVVAPLDLEKLDASGSGSSESFFQNTDGYFAIGQVIIDLYGPMVDVLEYFGLLWDFETLAK